MNKRNKVVTYEFGVNLITEMIQMMDKLGYTSKIISRGDRQGLVYFESDYRQGSELDKATAWLDAKGLKYYYTKEFCKQKGHHLMALFMLLKFTFR